MLRATLPLFATAIRPRDQPFVDMTAPPFPDGGRPLLAASLAVPTDYAAARSRISRRGG